MRLTRRIIAVTIALSLATLAGCATTPTVPPSVEPAPPLASVQPPPASPEPTPFPLTVESTRIARFVVPSVFAAGAAADLEPLPEPAQDLWDRIVKGYAVPELEGPLVEKWERYYADRPDYVARMIDRSRRYLYHIVSEIDRRRMPLDIALLPMVESAFNPTAVSSARASGIWQFMPSTGRHYGLAQNFWFDARRDVIAATDKALDYLQRLHGMFNDWHLALAAYNWGEGNVGRALQRNGVRDYLSLPMPDETRNYLPKLQALKNIVRDPEKYGLVIADVPDAPYFTVVKVDRKIDVKRAAELAELSEAEFVALNPQHNRPVIAGADEFTILLPIDKAELFAAKLQLHDQPLVSWQAYRVRDGETLAQVAARFKLSVETLRTINGLGLRTRIPPGHPLLVPAERPGDVAHASIEKSEAVFTVVPQGRTFYHTVRRGETLHSIAARYNVSAADLREWNGLSQSALNVGRQLRVTSDVVRNVAHGKARTVAAAGARSIKGQVPPTNGAAPARANGSGGKASSAPKGAASEPATKEPAARTRNGSPRASL
ncbi:MAG TPA: transglycosylase SLT domain-containing protein [Casimicrobiaceae bacterium]|nr:transglycosylase SLT domain-containing protein [Casimicrobiaceae bacterium]